MRVESFLREHLKAMELDETQRAFADAAPVDWDGKAITVFDGGPVAAFGLAVEDGVGTAWAMVGRNASPFLHRVVKRNLAATMEHFGLRAIRAEGRTERGREWLRRLGFVDGVYK